MKKLTLLIGLFAALFLFQGCDGPEGPQGPQGTQGLQGIQGEQGPVGPQGTSGNTNVLLYDYGEVTLTTSTEYLIPDMPVEKMDSTLILAFLNPGEFDDDVWISIPGVVPSGGGNYIVISVLQSFDADSYSMMISTINSDGTLHTTSKTWRRFRIFAVQASSILPGGRMGDRITDIHGRDLNVGDYDAVCEYFGFSGNQ